MTISDETRAGLRALQLAISEWATRNFGLLEERQTLLGIMEEVGELAHAQLKSEQNIRHTPEEILEKKKDAAADIVVFLMNYCTTQGFYLGDVLVETWEKVSQRDFVTFPKNGRTE